MKFSWETVAALAAVVLGVAFVLAFTPASTWEAIGAFSEETWAGLALMVAGVVAAFFGRPIATKTAEPKKMASTIRKKDGSVSSEAMVWLMVWGLAVLVALGRWLAMRGGLILLALVILAGCGAATAEQRTAYAVEQAHCLSEERAIVDRAGTTEEQDRADLAAERARCDAALLAIYGGPR